MIHYKVNEEKREVKCTLIDFYKGGAVKSVGIARCHDDDKFDVEKGKRIAFLRARMDEMGKNIGVYSDFKRRMTNHYINNVNFLDKKITRHREEIDRVKQEIIDITG